MQIFYVTAMFAVFALCIVLFTTARRILRASPLQSGELGLPRFEGFADSSQESAGLRWQPRSNDDVVDSGTALPMSAEAYLEEIKAVEQVPAETFERFESPEDEYESPSTPHRKSSAVIYPVLVDSSASAEEPRSGEIMRTRRTTTPAYTYFLEVLLIGVSAVVLVQTQRSTSRYRMAQPSRERVA